MRAPPRTAPLMSLALLTACAGPADPTTAPGRWIAPENGWISHRPPSDLVGAGFEVGDVVPDVRLRDQHDDEVALWQFYGEVVLVTVSAVWCAPCRDLAVDAEAVVSAYAGEGVVLLTILEEDAGGLTPELSDAQGWAETFGEHSPVLVDPERELASALSGQFPVILGLGRDLVVSDTLGGGTSDDLRELIESEL